MTALPTPEEAHRRNVQGGLTRDPAQEDLAARLTALQGELVATDAAWQAQRRRWRPFRGKPTPVRGLYLWGGVGRGKTYLMDLFHDLLPLAAKRRLHFHRFMRLVHDELRRLEGRSDPLREAAAGLARDTRTLCLDEFHVSDIGDAMILGELLGGLFAAGVTVVATSNTEPARLYENGLQRRRFLPAIAQIERHMAVVHVAGDADYRLAVLRRDGIYRVGGDSDVLLDSFHALSHGEPEQGAVVTIHDRPIRSRYCAGDVAWFDFDAVCAGPRSNDDYIELARLFSTVLVSGVPVFDAATEDQARRFIGLVDEFYDRNVKLLLAAAAAPDALYAGTLLTGEFARTASRLVEMQSASYLRRSHRP